MKYPCILVGKLYATHIFTEFNFYAQDTFKRKKSSNVQKRLNTLTIFYIT